MKKLFFASIAFIFFGCSSLFSVQNAPIVISAKMPSFAVCAEKSAWESVSEYGKEMEALTKALEDGADRFCKSERLLPVLDWAYTDEDGRICVPVLCEL